MIDIIGIFIKSPKSGISIIGSWLIPYKQKRKAEIVKSMNLIKGLMF